MSFQVYAGPGRWDWKEGGDHEHIKSMKVAYITNELKLTATEAQTFWPIYNEFTEKMQVLEKTRRTALKKARDKEEGDLTDADINSVIKMNFDTDQKILDLKLEYDAKLRKVISVKQLGKLYRSEIEFKREMLHKIRGHHGQNCEYDKRGGGGHKREH